MSPRLTTAATALGQNEAVSPRHAPRKAVRTFDKHALTWENEGGPGSVCRTNRVLTQQPDSNRRWDGYEPYPGRGGRHRSTGRNRLMGREGARKVCPTALKITLIEEQQGLCAYCLVPFGSVIQYGRRHKLSVIHFDHFVPFAYTNGNAAGNWVAACNFCNLIKGAKMFDDLAEAREYITDRWIHKRMYLSWEAPVSSELDPYRWAIKFGTFLASLPPRLAGSITYVKPYSAKTKPKAKPDKNSKIIFPVDAFEESA